MSGPDRYGEEGASDRRIDDVEAFERMQAADPIDPVRLPDADGPHGRALYEELMMSTSTPRPTRPRILIVAAAVLVALAGVVGAVWWATGGSADDPAPAPVASGDPGLSPGGMAMCAEAYSLATLPNRDFAFDGTLTAVEGDRMTFEVHESFAGELSGTVELDGAGVVAATDQTSSVAGPGLTVGQRALVAGSDTFAWGCGFTQPYDPVVADQWRQALG